MVSAAFALYALMRDLVGPAGASACVTGAAALLLLLAGVAASLKAGVGKRQPTLAERAAEFVRDKPLAALVATVAAGFLALRNPKTLAAIIRELMEPKTPRRP